MTKIVFTSDTHGKLFDTALPAGDILVLSGDILPNFSRKPEVDAVKQADALKKLDERLSGFAYKHILFVSGNHDWIFELNKNARKILKKIIYLEDESIELEGLKFYGSPWQPEFCGWAFNLPRKGQELKSKWDKIPLDTDVLITHSPPYGFLDQIEPTAGAWNGSHNTEHLGCELLGDQITSGRIRPRIHAFGHIHGSYGNQQVGKTLFVNAALCNEWYRPVNPPIVVDII